ncbi:MAG: GAF domain-containing protein [bacterium]|nr:GAF domain-containing protein [bacterium]
MKDPRIKDYIELAHAMTRGDFRKALRITSPQDDVDMLGVALLDLGEALEQRFLEIAKLSTITERANAGLLLDDVLEHVYDSFRPIIPYQRIGFALLEDDNRRLRAHWARSDSAEIKLVCGFSAPMEGSSLQEILRTLQPRILNDLLGYLAEHPDSVSTRLIVEEGFRSSLTCPLIVERKPIGFMFFSSTENNTYEDAHVELFKQIAGQLAAILEKSRLYQQLVELNQLKDKFLGIAAHDLRSPLGVVRGYLGLILSGRMGEIPERPRKLLERMTTVTDDMLALVNDLLDLKAIETGELALDWKAVDIGPFVQAICDDIRIIADDKSISVRCEVREELDQTVELDPNRIQQLLSNLLTNACKFSQPNTMVTVCAEPRGDELVLSVQDQGPGIPEEDLPKLFTEFSRATARPTTGERSTGLGLAIVKRIAEAHSGRVSVHSKVGEGTCFSVSLPRKRPDTPPSG